MAHPFSVLEKSVSVQESLGPEISSLWYDEEKRPLLAWKWTRTFSLLLESVGKGSCPAIVAQAFPHL
jgi:hypothetical protein